MISLFEVREVTTTSIALNWELTRPPHQPAHWRVHWQPQHSSLVSYSAPLSADRRTYTMSELNPFTSYRVCLVPFFYAPAPPTLPPPEVATRTLASAQRLRAHLSAAGASRWTTRSSIAATQANRASRARVVYQYQSGERTCVNARTSVSPFVVLVASFAAGVALALVALTLYLVLSQLRARRLERFLSKGGSTPTPASREPDAASAQCAMTVESGSGALVEETLSRAQNASARRRKLGIGTATGASSSSQLALEQQNDDDAAAATGTPFGSPPVSPLVTTNGFSYSSTSCNRSPCHEVNSSTG